LESDLVVVSGDREEVAVTSEKEAELGSAPGTAAPLATKGFATPAAEVSIRK